ncbi:primosomal replication protein N [Undibacterium sp. RTI2.1]|uniref:primosomal replication protein N n=1 Tax=unclassified Undibacterium TaxID=2630295 RepID=UPI002B22E321|nr:MULTISPECIES: primosomal replication protein N [unclassified Undibacterium]MEB0031765.1 primosomal replication protein N [Undibacterium sp. RTI2.1]MEB0117794.1 primosomal replication protein N [Undibacterium sp. RTI2.2]
MNQLKVVASIVEKSALRFTPAGIPIASAVLIHSSKQTQANAQRVVDFEINALAAGEISKRFMEIELGVVMQFTGFLSRKNRNSKSLVFHITEFETNLLD